MHRYSVRHIYLSLYIYTFIYIDAYRCIDIVCMYLSFNGLPR